MQDKLSRRKIARYAADATTNGKVPEAVVREVAAYLLESRRERELELIVRAIEDELEQRGIVVATVTSARPIDDTLRGELARHIDGKDVRLREVVDPNVIGGVRLQTPSRQLDATIKHKLTLLRGAKR